MSGKADQSPRYSVTVSGTEFTEVGGKVADVVVENVIDGADRFSVTLNYPYDTEFKKFKGIKWGTFKTGKKVKIKMGYGGGSQPKPVFSGKIQQIEAKFNDDRGPSVGISGYGLLHDMMQGTPDNSWKKKTLKSVVSEKLSSYFGKKTIEGASMKRTKMIQHNQSDYRFVQSLADKYGFEFYTERDKAFFKPKSSVGGSKVAELTYGEGMDSFEAEINESTAVQKVEVRYYDMNKEKEVVATKSTDANNKKKKVFRVPCRSKTEAEKIAKSKLGALSDAQIEGYGSAVRGRPEIVPGKTVKLKDLGKKFTGKYYVTKATHRMGGSGYRTSFEVTEVPE